MKFKRKNKRLCWCSLVIFLFVTGGIFSSSAFAWPVVNGMAICTAGNNQLYPQVEADGQGGAIIAWQDSRTVTNDIYAQRVALVLNTTGATPFLQETTLWALGGVAICTAGNEQSSQQLVSDGQGGAIITWEDYLSPSVTDIYALRVDASGNIASGWPVNGVAVCTAANNQMNPQLVADGQGGAIITWFDWRSGAYYDIYAQRVNAAGTPVWTLGGVAVCTAVDDQRFPQVVADGKGGANIAWQDRRSGLNYDIYSQRVDATGVVKWTLDGVTICNTGNDQVAPQVGADGQGGAIITWQDSRFSGDTDIYAQRIDALGTVKWTLNGVAVCTAGTGQDTPQIVADGQGGAIITWQDGRSGNSDVYAQRLDASGNIASGWAVNGIAVCTAGSFQNSPQVAADGQGGSIITWQDFRNGNGDIYVQQIDFAGTTTTHYYWPGTNGGVSISTAGNDQMYPQVVADGQGGAIITWFDYRNTTGNPGQGADIYTQRVNAAGTPLWTLGGVTVCTAGNDQVCIRKW